MRVVQAVAALWIFLLLAGCKTTTQSVNTADASAAQPMKPEPPHSGGKKQPTSSLPSRTDSVPPTPRSARVPASGHIRLHERPAQGGSPATQPATQPADEAQQVHAWYQSLPAGWVRYEVPKRMTMQKGYTVSAIIPPLSSGKPGAPDQDPATTQTVDKGIHVATYMRVQLTQPSNPGVFKIVPPASDCRFVSLDGSTRWDFTVTPLRSGEGKKLTFTTTVLYGQGDATCSQENLKTIDVTTDTESVRVDTLNPGEAGDAFKDNLVTDPGKWAGYLKYVLPGGAVFSVIAGAVAWWKKRSARKNRRKSQ